MRNIEYGSHGQRQIATFRASNSHESRFLQAKMMKSIPLRIHYDDISALRSVIRALHVISHNYTMISHNCTMISHKCTKITS